MYNSLKACKGNMFFLPLPMHKTMETLDDVEEAEVALSFVHCRERFNTVSLIRSVR